MPAQLHQAPTQMGKKLTLCKTVKKNLRIFFPGPASPALSAAAKVAPCWETAFFSFFLFFLLERWFCVGKLRRRIWSLLRLLRVGERDDGDGELDLHHQPELPEQLCPHLHTQHPDLHDCQVPG